MPPKTAEICRQKSVEFEELAKQLGNPGWAEQFWKLAEQWRQLADQIECYDLEKINPNPPGGHSCSRWDVLVTAHKNPPGKSPSQLPAGQESEGR